MTDQLETDLRAELAARAAEVTPDIAGGEVAIRRRLSTDDAGVADVVSLRPARQHRLRLVAAAAALVVVIGVAIALAANDPEVQTGPAATTPPPPAAVLELHPVLLEGPCTALGASAFRSADGEVCYQLGAPLPGNELIEQAGLSVAEATKTMYGVALTLTREGIVRFNALAGQCFERAATCPTGRLAIVVDGVVLSAPSVNQREYERDAIEISGDFSEAEAEALVASLQPEADAGSGSTDPDPTSVPPAEELEMALAVGEPGDAAKDVAERYMRDILGDESVTASAEAHDGATFLTMETSTGAEVVAEVVFDTSGGVPRLVRLQSPGLELREDDGARVATPEGGLLTITLYGSGRIPPYGPDLAGDPGEVVVDAVSIAGPGTDHGPFDLPESSWLRMDLETADGRVLRYLSRR